MSFLQRVGNLVSGVFRGPTGNWDLGRIIGFKAGIAYPFVYVYALIEKGSVPDPSQFGLGYAAVLGGIGILIGAKDIAVAKANATPPVAPPSTMPPGGFPSTPPAPAP